MIEINLNENFMKTSIQIQSKKSLILESKQEKYYFYESNSFCKHISFVNILSKYLN
jgi:hypothetical protein